MPVSPHRRLAPTLEDVWSYITYFVFFLQAGDGIRDIGVTGVQTCALPIYGPPVPQHGAAVHLGVASCASSTCHGAAAPVEGGVVLGNENTTWQTLDKHAQAYAVLGQIGRASRRERVEIAGGAVSLKKKP